MQYRTIHARKRVLPAVYPLQAMDHVRKCDSDKCHQQTNVHPPFLCYVGAVAAKRAGTDRADPSSCSRLSRSLISPMHLSAINAPFSHQLAMGLLTPAALAGFLNAFACMQPDHGGGTDFSTWWWIARQQGFGLPCKGDPVHRVVSLRETTQAGPRLMVTAAHAHRCAAIGEKVYQHLVTGRRGWCCVRCPIERQERCCRKRPVDHRVELWRLSWTVESFSSLVRANHVQDYSIPYLT